MVTVDSNFWLKIGFIVFVFVETMVFGFIPTWSANCRENPKIFGIANAFAGGVFIAIAFVHILPEQEAAWIELRAEATGQVDGEYFPLPEFLTFLGYTFILIIDKVMFDTHSLFEEDHEHGLDNDEVQYRDPADRALIKSVRDSMVEDTPQQRAQSMVSMGEMSEGGTPMSSK